MEVMLNDSQTAELKKYIFELTRESIELAQKNAGLSKPFLKQKKMAEYLGISVNKLKDCQKQGLPVCQIDGLVLYNKEEVSKWILLKQK